MTTTTHVTHSRAETPETAQGSCTSVHHGETPMISKLAAAMLRLERLAETAGSPVDEAAAHRNGTTPEQHRVFVLGNADRIRAALGKISAPYEAPVPSRSELPAHDTAVTGESDRAGGHLHRGGVPAAVAAFQETAALYAVLTGDREGARQIVTDMLPSERAQFADQVDELRKLLGPICDNCGNLAEIGNQHDRPLQPDVPLPVQPVHGGTPHQLTESPAQWHAHNESHPLVTGPRPSRPCY